MERQTRSRISNANPCERCVLKSRVIHEKQAPIRQFAGPVRGEDESSKRIVSESMPFDSDPGFRGPS